MANSENFEATVNASSRDGARAEFVRLAEEYFGVSASELWVRAFTANLFSKRDGVQYYSVKFGAMLREPPKTVRI